MFLLKFENYALLADYDDTQQIELLEQNADKEIVLHLILEKGCYASLHLFKADLQQAGARKQLLNFIQKGTAEQVKQKDPNTMLRLGTPNSVLMNLVDSLLFPYLIRLTYDSHAISMLLFSFHIMLHALLTSLISVQCMAMSYFFSSILPPPCGRLMHHFASIPWPCLMHAPTSCY